MTKLDDLLQNENVGFTVYLPDCSHSRLWGNLDLAIHKATGFQPVYRYWFHHDVNTMRRFYARPDDEDFEDQDPLEGARKYDQVPLETLQYGHLMARVLLAGPSLMTFWQGEQAVPHLLALKGQTHPADAGTNTIRGSFWIDNAVANLMHTSDDYDETRRELKAIKATHLLEKEVAPLPLMEAIPAPTRYAAHCGISVVCDLVNRMLMGMPDVTPIDVQLPASGDAKETDEVLTALLRGKSNELQDREIGDFIESFLAGDHIAVTRKLATLPVTRWEFLIIQCSTMTRDKWNAYAARTD